MRAVFRIGLWAVLAGWFSLPARAQTVTGLQGFWRDGQVFLTWNEINNASAYYKIYRHTAPITSGSQLAACEYLGKVNSNSSVNHSLSYAEKTTRYLKIDPNGSYLSANSGLFVGLTLAPGNYYYAVTTVTNGTENTTIIAGSNSLTSPVAEQTARIVPVFQQTKKIGPLNINIYTVFLSSKYASGLPLMLDAAFVAFDFAVFLNNASGNNPLRIFFHGGGTHYLENIGVVDDNEVRINVESVYPDTSISSEWWGANEQFDVFNNANNSAPPAAGRNVNHGQQFVSVVIDWAIRNLPIDSNRIYLHATSDGSTPAFMYALTYPERIAAIKLAVGTFNLAFQNDWQANCALNSGKKKRKELDNRLGTVASNLPTNLGINTYDALNGGWMIGKYPQRSFPFVYSINGKQDKQTGWTEKTQFYDSVNLHRFGGWFFWDNRTHDGAGKTWVDANFDLYRFRRNVSFPAVTYCSLNEHFGNGNGNDGAPYGTLNGAVDWNPNISETSTSWQVKLFVRNLKAMFNTTVVYPDSCTSDVTPRRLQSFTLTAGATYAYQVVRNNKVIQSGTVVYDGKALVIPAVKIYRDTSVLTITLSSQQQTVWYQDLDNDTYGNNSVFQYADVKPLGYVATGGDCNDQNASVHPGATEICSNTIDDDCDGLVNESTVTATVTPSGTVYECKGKKVKLTANSGNGLSYQWLKNGSAIAGATGKTYSTKKNESGNFSVVVTNSQQCSSTSEATSVQRYEKPDAVITPLGSTDLCATGSVVLQANSGSGLSYQWVKGTSTISGATQMTYTATQTGTYKVVVTNSNGCSETSSGVKVTKNCRMNNTGDSLYIVLYPNPNSGRFQLSVPNGAAGPLHVKIFNLSGRLVFAQTLDNSSIDSQSVELDLRHALGAGCYLMRCTTSDRASQQLLIIQHE
ncbi:MAG: MopE-related protein [Chitinophagales bacterium]|nr:MopE-related protein [Chitinophagales bacterium]MDW8393933.1 MopE-related protein [Chitinophagales bacterium]